ncbi:MAG: efflux transporter outer membrane subunit [Holophagales bacterium]|nr:efflux transporter outer membrane subunit [Holophagales bacterium]
MRLREMHPTARVFAGLFLAAVASGCASGSSPEAASAAVFRETGPPPDQWLGDAEAGEVQVDWISSFDDAVLAELVREAQEHNKNLRAAAANVSRARALAAQAGAALEPAVSVNAGANRSGNAASSTQVDKLSLGLDISWEVDVWGRIEAGRRAAVASAEAAEADFRFARYSLAGGVARAYFVAIEAGLQASVAEETVEALEETLRIVELRYEEGMVGAQDLALARSDLASSRDRLVVVQGSRRDALRSLEILLGRYPGAELEVRPSLPAVPSRPPAGLPSELLERRPDLISAERRVAAAFDAVEQAKAARLPSVSLSGTIGGSSNALSNLLDPANVAWRVGTSLLAPLFDGGTRRAQVEIATAEQEQALAAYGQAALEAFGEVEQALDLDQVLGQRLDELAVASREAKEAYRIATLRYEEGETDLLEVLNVRQRVFSADNSLVSVERQLLTQRVDLHLALGGAWDGAESR